MIAISVYDLSIFIVEVWIASEEAQQQRQMKLDEKIKNSESQKAKNAKRAQSVADKEMIPIYLEK